MAKPHIVDKHSLKMEMEPGEYFWCSCGKSVTQPFCDGSHQGSEFKPELIEIKETKTVHWCMCKHTGRKPFCDGTHRKL